VWLVCAKVQFYVASQVKMLGCEVQWSRWPSIIWNLTIPKELGQDCHGIMHKEKSNMLQQCIKILLLHLYDVQHVLGDTPPIIRSLKLHWQPLVFHSWEVVGRCQDCAWQCPPSTYPTTSHVWNTRGWQCSFRLLMMGGVSPETCWASYKWNN
jgi:hypothetical protein